MIMNKKFNNNDSNNKQMSQEMNQIQEEFMQSLDDKQLLQFEHISSNWNRVLKHQEEELKELEQENSRLLRLLEAFNRQLTDQLP